MLTCRYPRIPNLPFFYLVYRAWSHWKAISGGKHVQWLVENKLLLPSPSKVLDQLYSKAAPSPASELAHKEQLLLTQGQVRNFSETLDVPALEIELERAIWQVEKALQEEQSSRETKEELNKDGKSESNPQDSERTQGQTAPGKKTK